MHIQILQVVKHRKIRSNKDTNGGYGTVNDFGRGMVAVFLKYLKSKSMRFPEILPAYVRAILKRQGHFVTYAQNKLDPNADIVLLQTSIINFYEELGWVDRINRMNPRIKVGFMGGMAMGNPQKYMNRGDFVIVGEIENALLNGDIANFSGLVDAGKVENLDSLPFPDWSHILKWKGGYGLIRTSRGRFLPMLSSRGCPMTCSYYCTYPLVQGKVFRARTPENVVEEIEYLQKQYDMTTVMFRDPIFSLKMERIENICELILKKGLAFSWICETHSRFLTSDLASLMARAGCVSIKLGIESGDLEVMKKSNRAAPDLIYQEEIVRCLEKQGIDVLAFYVLGYFDDMERTILKTIEYAKHLNTYGAQFTIATPYPGTQWYKDLSGNPDKFSLDENLENYTQYHLVYNHPHLSSNDLEHMKSLAYRRYYMRWAYLMKHFLKRL